MEINGEIQNLKKDRKALQIDGIWYNSNFKELDKEIEKGMNVLIKFTKKGDFNNIKSVEILDRPKSNNGYRKILQGDKKEISDTCKNCIIMTAKDFAIGKNISIVESVKQIIEAYNLI